MDRGPQHGAELGIEQRALLEGEADGAQAERRIGAGAVMAGQRLGQLVAAHIQGAGGHRLAVQPFDELAQRAVLLLLVGQAVAVHEHELGAQQPDALGAGLQRHAELARQLEIGIERDLGAVAGHRRAGGAAATASADRADGRPDGGGIRQSSRRTAARRRGPRRHR